MNHRGMGNPISARRAAAQAREYHAIRERAHEVAVAHHEFIREQSFLRTADPSRALTCAAYVEATALMLRERETLDAQAARRFNALRAVGIDVARFVGRGVEKDGHA